MVTSCQTIVQYHNQNTDTDTIQPSNSYFPTSCVCVYLGVCDLSYTQSLTSAAPCKMWVKVNFSACGCPIAYAPFVENTSLLVLDHSCAFVKNQLGSGQWNIIQHQKEMSYPAVQRHGETFKKCIFLMREANRTRLRAVGFPLLDILEKAKLWGP